MRSDRNILKQYLSTNQLNEEEYKKKKMEETYLKKLENRLGRYVLSHFLLGEKGKKTHVGPIIFFFSNFFLSHFLL